MVWPLLESILRSHKIFLTKQGVVPQFVSFWGRDCTYALAKCLEKCVF